MKAPESEAGRLAERLIHEGEGVALGVDFQALSAACRGPVAPPGLPRSYSGWRTPCRLGPGDEACPEALSATLMP